MKVDKTKWGKSTILNCCDIQLGTRIVKKQTIEGCFPVYGGGGATFTTNTYNRENAILISRFALSKECTRFVTGKFFLNDSGLTLAPKDKSLLFNFLKWQIFSLNDKIYDLARGAAQKNLDMKRFPLLTILIPPLAEQRAIAAELDAVQKMIEGYKAQLADLDALAQSIFLDMFGDPITNPKGWEKEYLSNICVELSTGPFGSMLHKTDYQEDGIPTINPQDIKSNKIKIDNIAKVSQEKAKVLFRYSLKENDIILARRGDLSKCAVITSKENGWLCGTGSFFLRLKNLLPIIFYHQYTTDSIQKYLNNKSAGATMPNLNQGILSQLLIAIPPLPLQQQFAERVEAIERQKELLQAQLDEAQTLMAERMQYYFD